MLWLLRTVGVALAKALVIGEYNRIKAENKRARDYGILIHLMEDVAKKRLVACKPDELSEDCPMATVINQYYQDGRTTSGTAALRIFTIVGSDGQVINVQGFDLSQTIGVTIRHTNGKMDHEQVDPSEAMNWIRREAGYSHAH